jgi:hypothetical protein
MLIYENTFVLIGTRRTTQENSTTQDVWLCLGELIRNLTMWYALLERGWGLTGVGV